MIAGPTHPQVARREGEEYRLSSSGASSTSVSRDHVEFDDRFLSIDELADLLAATDVFVTPYRNREQISSGALTFALAAGCAVVSTPYWYAEDMLSSGAGTLVPFGDSAALAAAVSGYIEHPEQLAAARVEAARIGARLAWPSVAERPPTCFVRRSRCAPRRAAIAGVGLEFAEARTDHLLTLVDDVRDRPARERRDSEPRHWLLRRRRRAAGRRRTGARAPDGRPRWTAILYRALAFLVDASEPRRGHAELHELRPALARRAARRRPCRPIGLGARRGPRTAWVPALSARRAAARHARGSLNCDVSLRTAAYAILGFARLDADRLDDEARDAARALVDAARGRLRALRGRRLALVRGLAPLRQRPPATGADRRRKALGRETRSRPGSSRSPGSATSAGSRRRAAPDRPPRSPPRRARPRTRATSSRSTPSAFVEAELAAFAVTGDPEHGARAQRAFDWFLGRNRLDRPLYDFATGGCSDGLGDEAINDNEGAESTLAFHRAQLVLDAAGPSRSSSRAGGPRSRPRERSRGELFCGIPANPILTADDWPTGERSLQPGRGVVDGETVLLARVEDRTGISTYRRTLANGVDGWAIDSEPLLAPRRAARKRVGLRGRAHRLGRRARPFVITCTAYGPAGPAVFLATTTDFTSVERHGIIKRPRTRTPPSCPSASTAMDPLPPPDVGFGGSRGAIFLSRSTTSYWSPPEASFSLATAPGGTRFASASARRCSRPSTAGC